jgi:hypothetical protein
MNDLLRKLNYAGQDPVLVLNAPAEFAHTMKELSKAAIVVEAAIKIKTCGFAIVFATKQREVDAAIKALAPKLEGDAVLWFAYPKGTSKRYTCDFNRDTGWAEVGKAGFEGVRAVAIDEDWSGLRFRRVEFVKKMTRSFAMTEEGKATVNKGR